MSHDALINLVLLITTGVVAASAGAIVWVRVRVPGGRAMAFLLFALALNSMAYAFEFATASLATKVALERALLVGWEILPALWLVFALQYTGRGRYLTRGVIAILCVVPILGLGIALTDGAHHLLLSAYSIPPGDPFLGLDRELGSAFWVSAAYDYALFAVGTVVLLGLFWHSWSMYRRQAVALLVAVLLPWVADVVTLSGVQLIKGLDVGTPAFLVSALLLVYSLTRLRVNDVLAVSRTTILDSLLDSVMVLDEGGRVLYSNPAGGDLLERLVPDVHREAGIRVWPHKVHALPLGSSGDAEPVTQRLAEGVATYDLRLSPVRDSRTSTVAHVLVARDITGQLSTEEELRASGARLGQALDATVKALSAAVESRDPYTAGHQRRVSELATAMALRMGLGAERAEGVRVAGMLHDVGKITIPAEILSKPGRLTTIEFALIKGHSQAGFEILRSISFPWPVSEMAVQHHERQDGSGYPSGLKGDEILPEARILAVADVIEAMASDRPYRAALGVEVALEEVRSGAGTRYEVAVVEACEAVFEEGFAFTE